jgi:hypothetical protein
MKLTTIKILALGVAGLLTLSVAQAATLITTDVQVGDGINPFTPSYGANVGSASDVLLGLTPFSSSVTQSGPTSRGTGGLGWTGSWTQSSAGGLPVLTDGAVGPIGAGGGFSTSLYASVAGFSGGAQVTYLLATAVQLTDVQIYGGWGDNGRDEQKPTLSVSTDGGTTWTELASQNVNPTVPGGVQVAVLTTFTDTVTPFLDNNALINGIRVDWFSNIENNWAGTSEIVAHAAAAPEPSTIALGLSGALVLGLCLFRRRIA